LIQQDIFGQYKVAILTKLLKLRNSPETREKLDGRWAEINSHNIDRLPARAVHDGLHAEHYMFEYSEILFLKWTLMK
jgi:hypothetical protein